MSIWQGERDDLVRGTMVRPEMFTIEGKRPTRERHDGDIFEFRCFLPRIKARNRPALAVLLRSAQDVNQIVDKDMPADLRPNVDLADNLAVRVELQHSMFIPLT